MRTHVPTFAYARARNNLFITRVLDGADEKCEKVQKVRAAVVANVFLFLYLFFPVTFSAFSVSELLAAAAAGAGRVA